MSLTFHEQTEEEEELKCLGFRPQSRIGECEGCKAVCEECENLMIMEEEEVLDSNGNSNSDYKKAEKECPIGYIVVWNRWEKGFKYRKLDKDGYMEQLEEEEEEYQWWGHTYTDERGNTISFFNATEKWIEENAEYKYNEYGQLECFKDMR